MPTNDRRAMRLYGTQAGWYYFINDHLETPQKIINASGEVVWAGFYQPFGKAWAYPADITNNFRFPGQYYDAETGLYYNWHQYYDPDTGRYITPDPIGLEGGINLYAYVRNDPVNLTDPFGLYESPWYLHWVPGQHFYDLGMTALENGEYGWAAVYFAGMGSEQILFFATLNEGSAIRISKICNTGNNIPKIKGTQKGLRNPSKVEQIKKDMLEGNYRYTDPEGIIGGYIDENGVYYIGEGHHRMTAAIEIFKETGDLSHINKLLRYGLWTKVAKPPAGSRPLP